MYFLDTETCGLHGPTVLIQYAKDEGDIYLHHVFYEPVHRTLRLIESVVDDGIIGFNLTFDWFHLCQTYTVLSLFEDKESIPSIKEYALKEQDGRFGPCLKPTHALDLMLHARKGPYQSTMDRKDIRIKRVPVKLAYKLAKELDTRIELKDIYFARKKNPKRHWHVCETEDRDPDFRHVVLKFAPSSALKALAMDALNITDVQFYSDVEVPKQFNPVEYGYAPFAIGKSGDWRGSWPVVIHHHIKHWFESKIAQQYAVADVDYTRRLYHFFEQPAVDDDDSVLACMVGAIRWRGYNIDVPYLHALHERCVARQKGTGFNYRSSEQCKRQLSQVMNETEKKTLIKGTGKIILESISKWRIATGVCPHCRGEGCKNCVDGLIETNELHPAAKIAREILDLRKLDKEIELLKKLLIAKRFHASFKIIGALSSRMSGADGLNPQGINKSKDVRRVFTLADPDFELCGGDFSGFEVTIMDAVYQDPKLREELLLGKKIHALFGVFLFPDMTYEEIIATDGLPEEQNKYGRSKNGVFAMFYGGEGPTLVRRVGVTEDVANKAFQLWCQKYLIWGQKRQATTQQFCSMRQPKGLGTEVEWHEPASYCETLFGFRRYFTLENRICRALFDMASDPPPAWTKLKFRVVRRDREQTICGAVRSALFGAAFSVQSANMRAAANHEIQGTGAGLTKRLQRRIWDNQPTGIQDWAVMPMNVHDEVLSPCKKEVVEKVKTDVNNFIQESKDMIPLIGMKWKTGLQSWADK